MYHKHFHWPLQSHTSTFTGLCKVTQAHSLASASYTSIFTALWQVKPLFFSSFRTYIASFVFIEGSRHLHLFMYRCNNKILYWHIVFIIIYSHFKTLTGVKFCSYRMTNTFDIFYLFVSLFPVFLVCQRLQIICGCFTPVHQQGVLWAHEAHDEASWDEPFSEPICWKASKLHEASSRHHYWLALGVGKALDSSWERHKNECKAKAGKVVKEYAGKKLERHARNKPFTATIPQGMSAGCRLS